MIVSSEEQEALLKVKLPKVSGILPVGYGSTYFRTAADAFLASTYEGETELIILDNNEVPIEDLIPDDPRVRYYHCDRMPVGALRNLGTSYATGDICVTIDEDDWSHPERVSYQVTRLLVEGKSVTGFHSIYYYDMDNGSTFKYWYEPNGNHAPYACGSSQMYTKAWWTQHKFPATGVEDFAFQQEALSNRQLDSCDGAELLVARAHANSACPISNQFGRHRQFPSVPKEELPAEFYNAIAPKAVAKPKYKTKAAKQEIVHV